MQDNETITLEPRPPQQVPEGYSSGYWQRSRLPVVIIGCGTLLVVVACIVIAVAAYVTFNGEDDPEEAVVEGTTTGQPTATVFIVGGNPSPTSTPVLSPTISPTELSFPTNTPPASGSTSTFTFVPPSRIPATNTPAVTNTRAFTRTSTITQTATATPPPTNTSSVPTSTTQPTLVPPTIIPSSQPTITRPAPPSFTPQPTIPEGQHIELMYDNNSFYAHNSSSELIRSGPLRFEAVNGDGEDAGYTLYGTRWSDFYEFIEVSNCAAIEITQSPPWLRPVECGFYNAILTPQRSNPGNFWLERAGVVEFRVLYNEIEIARCPIGRGTCDIYVP